MIVPSVFSMFRGYQQRRRQATTATIAMPPAVPRWLLDGRSGDDGRGDFSQVMGRKSLKSIEFCLVANYPRLVSGI